MSSKGVGGDEDYVCTLDEKSLKKAKEELNEDPKNRLGAVETFRQWILQQPHIKCPTDTSFLLCFLRVRYFAQLEARALLERYLTSRKKCPKWYENLDTADPKIQAVLDTGLIIVLPKRDDDGHRLLLLRGAKMDLTDKPFSKVDLFRAWSCINMYVYLMDEATCVNGSVSIGDMTNYSMKHHLSIPMEDRKAYMTAWQDSFPARFKQMNLYNAGAMVDIIFALMKLVLSEKLQKRVKNHGSTLESVYKDVPMQFLPVEYLPDDYKGPNAGTENQLIDDLKKDLLKPEVRARIKYLSSDQFGIDESKRPKDDAPQASFRKLNIE